MNVVIVGAKGAVGAKLFEKCRNIWDILPLSSRDADITDYNQVISAIRQPFDVLINCAAKFEKDEPEGYVDNEKVNSIGVLNLLKAAKRCNAGYFVQISTIFAIDSDKNHYFNSYGLSKKHGDENVLHFCRAQMLGGVILRFSQIYDAHGLEKRHQPFLYSMIERISQHDNIMLSGSSDVLRNYIYIDDVVEIIKRVVELRVEGIYHAAHPQSVTIMSLLQTIKRLTRSSSTIDWDNSRKELKRYVIPQDSRLYDLINYYPQVDLDDGLKKILSTRK